VEILNVVLGIIVLIVAVWVAIFGGVGALLSRSRGASGISGFAWGTLLGPIGWLAIFIVTRSSAGQVRVDPGASLGSESAWTTRDPWDD
jgi:hypothetical protein